ncbi:NADP-dependent oxidoreductase [Planosporangium thailandense]|uniref:NADP-dependent oxidoreductase n=1 Tax=Planosporangium thailandense TaxID=765197 RepID=A0ABX0XR14_9ACTN|nr:NADP-dependent oxidoreductase [Planosporangium thailandense]NJC68430.1 NADP-dependent oxidoreductase [Planosporangium thailandense]
MTGLMRAINQEAAGGPEALKLVEVERPETAPVEILVRVHAAGVNPADWKTRARGAMLDGTTVDGAAPFILGWDVSGVVEAVGPGVTLFRPGDEVFGMPRFPHPAGAYAEYVAAPPRHFTRKPAGIDHVTAAALPLAALTAWQALVDTADVQSGQRVLIHAAAGGVGHLAVQIAKSRGAYVVGTSRQAKHDFVRSLGADEVVDYTRADFAEALGDLDVVLDTIGGDYGLRSLRTLRRGGTLVSIVPPLEENLLKDAAERGVRAGFMLVEPDHAGMNAIAALVESGDLRVAIDTVVPLDQVGKAHERGESGRTQGKIVLRVVE